MTNIVRNCGLILILVLVNLQVPAATAGGCSADTNNDNVVDVLDLNSVLSAWGTINPAADVTGDGIVDVQDLVAVINGWGSC